MRKIFTSIWLAVVCAAPLCSAEITGEGREFFESKIRPILVTECYGCHGAKKAKGGLRLDSRDGLLQGGDSGAALVAGDPDKSLLIQSIAHTHEDEDLHMPKDGAKLDDATLRHFMEWIRMGAPDPRDKPEPVLSAEQSWEQTLKQRMQWWSFQPVKNAAPPDVKDTAWSQHPVDRFILAKLEEQGLPHAAQADAATLIRRLCYVITGLPPVFEDRQMGRQGDGEMVLLSVSPPLRFSVFAPLSQETVNTLVERLLASPRFGERWARHWMDWVRYAESYGSEGDPPIPYAWRYRDYLIRAFNDDVPYTQLVREAIAGDLLPQPRINAGLGINESALGIGQLRMVLHGFSPTDTLDEMVTFTDNQIDTVTKAFQALTVSCARCHNHKFDAISQADFYALYGIFTSTHPAVIDVNAPGTGGMERAELTRLKAQLKPIVARAWLAAVEKLTSAAKPKPAAPAQPVADVLKRWDLRKPGWYADGAGVAQGPSGPGEFSVAVEGDRVIARVHPSGIFSDLISTKDRGVLISPRFQCEGGTLWMRSSGGGGAKAKYVVQNYPRTGTIHKAKEFKEEGDAVLGWRQLDLNYWKGDEIFIQCATASDLPAEARIDERSWFGITDVVITKGTDAPPSPAMAEDAKEAVTAWMNGTITDAQAELLDSLLAKSKLPNDLKLIPDAAPLLARYREIEAKLQQPTRAPGVLEAEGKDAALFVQGDHKRPADIIPRRFLEGIDPTPYRARNSGRLQLAESLARPDNPLTARVIVNRLWHHVFGRGIVATTDNFGRLGEEPTHRELLDHLAHRFMEKGGSIKEMLRYLVTSKTFQLDHRAPAGAAEKDPDNRLLSHFGVRRLEAEAIRDGILSLSGRMEDTMFGPSVGGGEPRRSIYVKVVRNSLDDFLTAFDAPVPSMTRGRRDATNVPAQSLALLNSPMVMNWAGGWAQRLSGDASLPTHEARVQRMFREAFGRDASASELAQCVAFMHSSSETAERLKTDLAALERQAGELEGRTEAVLSPVRQRLAHERANPAKPQPVSLPQPYAEWDFEDGAKDLKGRLPLMLEGSARVEQGALRLDGSSKSFAHSGPLTVSLREKTLEAWVMLDNVEQRGGGILTVQELDGGIFDALVFGEKEPQGWVAGSNNFKRTESFEGPPEQEAVQRPVHVAVVYDARGNIAGYRDGQPYGKAYQSNGPVTFASSKSQILLGCRHGSGGGNRMLQGRVLRARLYDRALKPAEVEASRWAEQTVVTEHDVMDAMNDADRSRVREMQEGLASLRTKASALRGQIERSGGPEEALQSLALSLMNLKEFIYLR